MRIKEVQYIRKPFFEGLYYDSGTIWYGVIYAVEAWKLQEDNFIVIEQDNYETEHWFKAPKKIQKRADDFMSAKQLWDQRIGRK